MTMFAIGDRVVLIDRAGYSDLHVGATGVVVKDSPRQKYIRVKWDWNNFTSRFLRASRFKLDSRAEIIESYAAYYLAITGE